MTYDLQYDVKITDTTFDADRTVALFKGFYTFHRNKQLRKIRAFWVILLAATLVGLGLLIDQPLLARGGTAIAFGLAAFIAYFFFSAQRAIAKTTAAIMAEKDQLEGKHQFGFDAQKLVYITNGQRSEVKWSRFSYYQQNGSAVYLFSTKKRLAEIISSEVIGDALFEEFLSLLDQKKIPQLYTK